MATPPVFSTGQKLTAAHMNAVGLWKVASATATSGAAIDVLGCFTADFEAYRIVVSNAKTAGAADVLVRLIDSTNTVQTAGYYSNFQYGNSWTAPAYLSSGVAGGANSQFFTGSITNSTGTTGFSFDLFQPQLAQRTTMTCHGAVADIGWQPPRIATGLLPDTTVYTGVRIYTGSTWTTVRVTVYGYRI